MEKGRGESMCIRKRVYQLDGEWTIVLVPEKPNGFGVFIFGDVSHFVDSETSFWLQNHTRASVIGELLQAGYTVYTSNLYGRHWGSEASIRLAERIYKLVHKQEILNDKIHILAEGMGVLAANSFQHNKSSRIRSAAYLNPCINVKDLILREQKHKLFYKRLIKEIALAYGIDRENVLETLASKEIEIARCPVKVWHHSINSPYSLEKIREYEQLQEKAGSPIELTLLSDSYQSLGKKIVRFFKSEESNL
ncbi:hypothetical protein [Guptibacillus algicola]|uniref:hypothetical protein n=1 Tax=Guptibacillus algicola TaxID=225844 RepID=UPI001CD330C5|nr:hypothetical protein [Alkalihalobacillus algicola]MCA0987796.1 hypothetical protein [Alkalihalobacillus algicola]